MVHPTARSTTDVSSATPVTQKPTSSLLGTERGTDVARRAIVPRQSLPHKYDLTAQVYTKLQRGEGENIAPDLFKDRAFRGSLKKIVFYCTQYNDIKTLLVLRNLCLTNGALKLFKHIDSTINAIRSTLEPPKNGSERKVTDKVDIIARNLKTPVDQRVIDLVTTAAKTIDIKDLEEGNTLSAGGRSLSDELKSNKNPGSILAAIERAVDDKKTTQEQADTMVNLIVKFVVEEKDQEAADEIFGQLQRGVDVLPSILFGKTETLNPETVNNGKADARRSESTKTAELLKEKISGAVTQSLTRGEGIPSWTKNLIKEFLHTFLSTLINLLALKGKDSPKQVLETLALQDEAQLKGSVGYDPRLLALLNDTVKPAREKIKQEITADINKTRAFMIAKAGQIVNIPISEERLKFQDIANFHIGEGGLEEIRAKNENKPNDVLMAVLFEVEKDLNREWTVELGDKKFTKGSLMDELAKELIKLGTDRGQDDVQAKETAISIAVCLQQGSLKALTESVEPLLAQIATPGEKKYFDAILDVHNTGNTSPKIVINATKEGKIHITRTSEHILKTLAKEDFPESELGEVQLKATIVIGEPQGSMELKVLRGTEGDVKPPALEVDENLVGVAGLDNDQAIVYIQEAIENLAEIIGDNEPSIEQKAELTRLKEELQKLQPKPGVV